MFPSNSTSEKPLFSARSSRSETSWNLRNSSCLNMALSSIMTLPSSATIEPSPSIASGFISANSASFSVVILDNFCKMSTKSVAVLSFRPMSCATS